MELLSEAIPFHKSFAKSGLPMDRLDQHTFADKYPTDIHVHNSKCYEYSAHENDSLGFFVYQQINSTKAIFF